MQPCLKNSKFVRKSCEIKLAVEINGSQEQLSIELQTLKSPPKLFAAIFSKQNLCQPEKELNISIFQLFYCLENYYCVDFQTNPQKPRVGCKINIRHHEIQHESLVFLELHQQEYSDQQRLKNGIEELYEQLNDLRTSKVTDLLQDASTSIKIEQSNEIDCKPILDSFELMQNIKQSFQKSNQILNKYLAQSRNYHRQIGEFTKIPKLPQISLPSKLPQQFVQCAQIPPLINQNKIYFEISDQQDQNIKQKEEQSEQQSELRNQKEQQDQVDQSSNSKEKNTNKCQSPGKKKEKKEKRQTKGLRILTKNANPYHISQKKICLMKNSGRSKSHQLVVDYPIKYMYPQCEFKIKILISESNNIKLGVIDRGNTKTKITKVAITYHGATGDINDWKVKENSGKGFKALDEVRVRLENGAIIWFVNGQVQATYYSNKLCLHYQTFYPFIEMVSEGDTVQWIQI